MIKSTIIAVSLLFASPALLAQEGKYQQGVHYFEVQKPTAQLVADKVVVTEVFSYACSHCNTFEPYMQSWKNKMPEYASLNRLPVTFDRHAWELLARGYMTAEMMGIAEKSHVPMMDAIWKERKQFRDVDDLADFYAGFGVEKEAYVAHYKSFATDSIMRKSQRDVRHYGIKGTPSLIVNGKYRIESNKNVANFDAMLDVVNYLVELEHNLK